MTNKKVLTIAGFDPSAGAGLLADIKTFERFGVYGYAVNTAITYQNSTFVEGVDWLGSYEIIRQLQVLAREGLPKLVKIGIVKNLEVLLDILEYLEGKVDFILYDPIIKSSSGYNFWQDVDKAKLEEILSFVSLITPNINEYKEICNILKKENTPQKFTNVLVKSVEIGVDILYTKGAEKMITDGQEQIALPAKHGSGCVYASAILANLALGKELEESCLEAKKYLSKFLATDLGLLGRHYDI